MNISSSFDHGISLAGLQSLDWTDAAGAMALDMHRANQLLSQQLRLFEAALTNMSQGLCMFDENARLVVCNDRYPELFGLPAGTFSPGMTQEEMCRLLRDRGCYSSSVTIESILEGTRTALLKNNGLPIIREVADGRTLAIRYRLMEGGGWVSTFEDITSERRSAERIAHLACHDALTDFLNAGTLREGRHDILTEAGADHPVLAALHLDLDRFKSVNDDFGHAVGDELLRAAADRIRKCVSAKAVLGRLGGDEFAVLQRVADDAAAIALANRLAAAVGEPYHLSVGRLEIGASIGVATLDGDATGIGSALQDADLALRHAKADGSASVCFFDPVMAEEARARRALEVELAAAVAGGQLELHYQPLVEIQGNRTVGVEALVRWRHPERGLVPPISFIPLAEEIGLIVPLGEWVMRQACRDAASWPEHILMAVNVSSTQMQQKSFADMVRQALEDSGLPPSRLEIEITESAILGESETIMRNLTELRQIGVRFAMDDFGTGYSSLSYLRRFPIDKIKIDRSFMKDAETSADALAIIRAVAGLGISLGITTLVEGVETENQLALARLEGLEQVQGYLFSRPQPKSVITEMLASTS